MDWLLQNKRVSKVLLACVGLVIMIVFIKYLPELLRLTMSLDAFRDYILSTGKLGPVMLVLFQILQTVIAPIPGEVVQIAGGYIYGTMLGAVYVTGGMMLGAMIAFYFTRFLGGSFIESLLQRDKFKWMRGMMDNKKFSIFLFIVFIIPGFPKDMFIYAAGLTTMKPLRFFMILLIARFPWLLASVSVGANIYDKNYGPTIVISAISVLAFILGLIYKDKLIDKLSSFKGGKSES
ncbi:VTT domain-containing protein [Paenibacillus sp. FSL R7-0337]|uniref:TVP38/TMEM64 family protein n=1 Tax=unclassified Paenibacillus TaxID=185978 RepID=UPI00096D99B6|nr:VTT domain-containing protein [Paenibacillus sp. FSL R7-0337]OMF98138.1 TVP38/TMEM64 family protein [Paenibacillus sp. FSL R7-0337]